MRFSNLNQPARLHINLYLFLIQTTLQLHPLVIIFFLKNMCFRIIYSWGVNAIRLVRVISCEPVMVETESMNFSEDSIFFKLIFNKVIIVYIKSDCMYRMKIACTVQVSFGHVLVLMPVEII